MKRMLSGARIVICLLAVGCGGGDGGPANPNSGGGGGGGGAPMMKATIDGVNWVATSSTVQVTGSTTATPGGAIAISGGNITSGIGVSLSIAYISAPGTFPLGVNPGSNAGGVATVTDAPDVWNTPLNGAAGTVTISTRTSTRIAGTFQFSASPLLGGGPDVGVTAGEFDITVSTGLPALPTGNPSLMAATLDGDAWNGATIVGIAGGASFGGSNTDYSINFVAKVPFVPGGAYDMGSEFGAQIIRVGTTDSWAVTVEDSVGYVTFVTVTAGRIAGFFAGTLPQFGTATTPLLVENGFFSVHVE